MKKNENALPFRDSGPFHVWAGSPDHLRKRLRLSPFRQWYEHLVECGLSLVQRPPGDVISEQTLEQTGSRIRYRATRAFFEVDTALARACAADCMHILESDIARDGYSKGLTRAAIVRDVSAAVELCRDQWSERERRSISEKLEALTYGLAASMGYESNNALASNWMGVRYGAIITAAAVLASHKTKNRLTPLLWESQRRIFDHISANIDPDSWNVESMGYHLYGWSFTGPAVRFLTLVYKNNSVLSERAPGATGSLASVLRNAVSIEGAAGTTGLKPDFSDDNLNIGHVSLAVDAIHYDVPELRGAYRWFFDYLAPHAVTGTFADHLAQGLLVMPDDVEAENPRYTIGLSHHFPESGVVSFRNRYCDEMDIVTVVNAKSTPRRGHNAADTNALRLIGLGVPWIIGAGRTSSHEAQTGMRPSLPPEQFDSHALGSIQRVQLRGGDGGYVRSSGSCIGVEHLEQMLHVDYSNRSGSPAVLVLALESENGEVYRLVTPEFNSCETRENGVRLCAPDGTSMLAQVLRSSRPDPSITMSRHRYGGSTVARNPGIQYQGVAYETVTAIDIACGSGLLMVLSLAEPSGRHPVATVDGRRVTVGSVHYWLT